MSAAVPFKGDSNRLLAGSILEHGKLAAMGYSYAERGLFVRFADWRASLLKASSARRSEDVKHADLLLTAWSELEAHAVIARVATGAMPAPVARRARG